MHATSANNDRTQEFEARARRERYVGPWLPEPSSRAEVRRTTQPAASTSTSRSAWRC